MSADEGVHWTTFGTNLRLVLQNVNAAQRQEKVDFALLGSLLRGVFIRSLDKERVKWLLLRLRKSRTALEQWRGSGSLPGDQVSFSSWTPVEQKHNPNNPIKPCGKTAALALCLQPTVQKVGFSVDLLFGGGKSISVGGADFA